MKLADLPKGAVMIGMTDTAMPRLAMTHLVAVALHVAVAIALLTVRPSANLLAPVQLSLNGSATEPFAAVDLAAAAAVVALIAAVARLAVFVPVVRTRYVRGLREGRHGVRWIEYSQTAAIAAFLVAQMNGIVEAGTLILVYAMGAGAVLLLWLHDRSSEPGARGLLAFSIGTAIAIVPWGVIALHHVVGIFAGPAPSLLVRAATLALLLIAAAHWTNVWLDHQQRAVWSTPLTAERVHIGLSVATSVTFLIVILLAPMAATEGML